MKNIEFIFLHDCKDCDKYHTCDKEKSFSTDCKDFNYKNDL